MSRAFTEDRADIKVYLRLEGRPDGMRSPLSSSHSAQFFYDAQDWDCRLSFPDAGVMSPGERGEALVAFLNPDAHRGRLHPGMHFQLREGHTVIGEGEILELKRLAAKATTA